MPGKVSRLKEYIQLHGLRYTIHRSAEKIGERFFGTYEKIYQARKADEKTLTYQRQHQPEAGLLSVVIPVYNTAPNLLTALLDSLRDQTYEHWEAVLVNAGNREETSQVLAQAAQTEPRFQVSTIQNLGIAGNTNAGIDRANGAWILLCDHDDLLTPDALWEIASRIVKDQPDVIYTDEDKVTEDGRIHTDSHCKPDFCPDNLRSSNYICHLLAARKALVQQVGGLCPDFDGSQDHDLALRLSEHTTRIAHVPCVAYHWRTLGTSMSHQQIQKCMDAACRAVEAHTQRIGYPCRAVQEHAVIRLTYEIQGDPKVSVITDGDWQPDWPNSEILHVSHWTGEAINQAAKEATGDVLLILSGKVQPVSKDFVRELLMYAQRKDVGAVIPVLTDGRNCITHAGYALSLDGTLHCRNHRLKYTAGGWYLLAMQSHNVAAVSPACVMIRTAAFRRMNAGALDGYAGADWSLRLMDHGLRHVYTPHAHGICTDEKLLYGDDENRQLFRERWQGTQDACYPAAYDGEGMQFHFKKL